MITDDKNYVTILERLPHIANRILLMWGSHELVKYIEHLMMDTRDGTRQGFPPDVAAALYRLLAKHHEDFPVDVKVDPWDHNHRLI